MSPGCCSWGGRWLWFVGGHPLLSCPGMSVPGHCHPDSQQHGDMHCMGMNVKVRKTWNKDQVPWEKP